MEPNKCIRVLADENQIKQCKAAISEAEEPIRHLAGLLNIAGNEVRLKILFLLQQEKQMCPCDLSDVLEMTVPAISQHLRKMKDKDLVRSKKTGQTIFYSLNEAHENMLKLLLTIVKEPLKV